VVTGGLIGKMASRLVAYETLYGQERQRIETKACTSYQSYRYNKFLVGVIASLVAIHMEAIRGLLNHDLEEDTHCQILRTYDPILYY